MKHQCLLVFAVLLFAWPVQAQEERRKSSAAEQQLNTQAKPHESYQRGRMRRPEPDRTSLLTLLRDAAGTYRQLTRGDSQAAQNARNLASRAKCIAVFPNVTRAALAVGGRGGSGTAACKSPDGVWSNLSFVTLRGASIGAQAGLTTSSVVMYFMDDQGEAALKSGTRSFGANLTVAAGDFDEALRYESNKPSVIALANERGFLASASLSGTTVRTNNRQNRVYYGTDIAGKDLLSRFDDRNQPTESEDFISALEGRTL